MKLYILRHGEAADHGDPRYKNDADRPLTPKGTQRTKALAHALRQMDITFDLIFSSPLVRARETAEIVERGLRLHGRLELTEHLAQLVSMLPCLIRVKALAACITGHIPCVQAYPIH